VIVVPPYTPFVEPEEIVEALAKLLANLPKKKLPCAPDYIAIDEPSNPGAQRDHKASTKTYTSNFDELMKAEIKMIDKRHL
jgi:hypothetical protein